MFPIRFQVRDVCGHLGRVQVRRHLKSASLDDALDEHLGAFDVAFRDALAPHHGDEGRQVICQWQCLTVRKSLCPGVDSATANLPRLVLQLAGNGLRVFEVIAASDHAAQARLGGIGNHVLAGLLVLVDASHVSPALCRFLHGRQFQSQSRCQLCGRVHRRAAFVVHES